MLMQARIDRKAYKAIKMTNYLSRIQAACDQTDTESFSPAPYAPAAAAAAAGAAAAAAPLPLV